MTNTRKYFSFELSAWVIALAYLAMTDPSQSHLSFCPFHTLGIFCPGCGLGRSVSYLLHGNLYASLHTHLLGVLALPVIAYRIFQLTKNLFNLNKQHYGKSIHSS